MWSQEGRDDPAMLCNRVAAGVISCNARSVSRHGGMAWVSASMAMSICFVRLANSSTSLTTSSVTDRGQPIADRRGPVADGPLMSGNEDLGRDTRSDTG